MTQIIRGVLNFQKKIFEAKESLFKKLAEGQFPLALFITCSDSRINPDLLAQTQPGELFVIRNAGNLVPKYEVGPGGEAATIEYALRQLHIRDIIICGHSKCGAMHGLLNLDKLETLPTVAGWLQNARDILGKLPPKGKLDEEELLNLTIQQNVLLQMENLRSHPAVADGIKSRTLRIHGWVYHFEKGKVDRYDPLKGKFVGLDDKTIRPTIVEHAEKLNRQRSEFETHI